MQTVDANQLTDSIINPSWGLYSIDRLPGGNHQPFFSISNLINQNTGVV